MELIENGWLVGGAINAGTNLHSGVNAHTHVTGPFMPNWTNNISKLSHQRAVTGSWDGSEIAFLYCGGSPNNYFDTATVICGYDLPNNFVVSDIVPLNRSPGAYVLMRDTTSSPKEAALFWIQKSAAGGLGGSEGTSKYRIMYLWRGKYDGFPEGCPKRMVLSPDDTTLALYDPEAAVNQKIRIYDLNNQRYPMQDGLIMNRYNSDTLFTAAPVLANVDLQDEMTRFCTRIPTQVTNIFNFDVNYRTGGRFYVDGTIYDGAIAWYNPDFTSYGSFSCSPTGGVPFQVVILDDGTAWGIVANHTTGSLSNPSGVSGAFPNKTLTGGPTWNLLKANHFRAFRFRPQLLKEIALDGTLLNGVTLPVVLTAAGDAIRMTFHRDTSRCILFLVHNAASDYLYGIGLFNNPSWATKVLTTAADEYVDIAESPDGRRLILISRNPDKVHLFDISYAFPYSALNLSALIPVELDSADIASSLLYNESNVKWQSIVEGYFQEVEPTVDLVFTPTTPRPIFFRPDGMLVDSPTFSGAPIGITSAKFKAGPAEMQVDITPAGAIESLEWFDENYE